MGVKRGHCSGRMAALMIALMILLDSACAFAISAYDPTAHGSVTIENTLQDTGTPLSGVSIEIFRVADLPTMSPAGYQWTNAFQECTVSLQAGASSSEQAARASEVSKFATTHQIEPFKTILTDNDGVAKLSDLPAGLYLVRVSQRSALALFSFEPFMLTLPVMSSDGTRWDYDVVAKPKSDVLPTVTRNPSDPGDDDDDDDDEDDDDDDRENGGSLPQTGHDYSDVFVLLALGGFLILFGCVCLVRGRRGKHQ